MSSQDLNAFVVDRRPVNSGVRRFLVRCNKSIPSVAIQLVFEKRFEFSSQIMSSPSWFASCIAYWQFRFSEEKFMFTKLLSLALAGLLVNLLCPASVSAGTKAEKDAQFAEKVRTGIAKLGTGPDARVEIKLRDKTKVKGYIKEIGEASFVVVDSKTGVSTEVPYPQVKQVKGNNLSKGAKIAIVVGVVVGIVVIIGVLTNKGVISKR